MKADLVAAALQYASLGWRVVPLKGKRPTLKDWVNRATNDPEKIRGLFGPTNTGLGILAGEGSGLMIIDVDPRNGGNESFQDLVLRLGELPTTVSVRTGGGGAHYYFRCEPGEFRGKPARGVDFIARENQMVVAPPSVHESGETYEWIHAPEHLAIPDLPQRWREYLLQDKRRVPEVPPEAAAGVVLEGARNDTLFRHGCGLLARGVSPDMLFVHLHEENRLRCKPRLDDAEVDKIAQNVLTYGKQSISLKTRWQEAITRDPALKDSTARVAMALATFANEHGGSCFPNQDKIGIRCAKGRNTVAKHLRILEEMGWIQVYSINRPGFGCSHGYLLQLPNSDQDPGKN